LVYRKIRHRLSHLERRIFKILYLRQPIFGYQIAAMNPVIMSFLTGMDDDTQILTLLVLILKRRHCDDNQELDKELERRWRAYLRFYPYWVEITRAENSESKREKTIRSKTFSLERPICVGTDGEELSHRDTVADPRSAPPDLLQAFVNDSRGKIAEWAKRYCTPTQARHITRFAAAETETKIAEDEGISQPAVSKSIRAAVKRMREGLVRDGILEVD
jgi:hypothetical protein